MGGKKWPIRKGWRPLLSETGIYWSGKFAFYQGRVREFWKLISVAIFLLYM